MHVYACLVHVQAWVCMLAMVMEHAPKPMVFGIDSLIFNCCLFKQRWPLLGSWKFHPVWKGPGWKRAGISDAFAVGFRRPY